MITNFKRNCLGTLDFTAKLGKMRKVDDFIVYPMQESSTEIRIQSDHRFGRVDLETGAGILSASRAQYANGAWLMVCQIRGTAEAFTLDVEDREQLRQWVKSTGGALVGGNNALRVHCDNTGAIAL
jgi:hypothetical protein